MERLVTSPKEIEDNRLASLAASALEREVTEGAIYSTKYLKRVFRVFNFAHNDLSYDNVLFRQDGSLVITDPVSGTRYNGDLPDSHRHSSFKRRQGMIRSLKAAA
jgi:hypothetical protein